MLTYANLQDAWKLASIPVVDDAEFKRGIQWYVNVLKEYINDPVEKFLADEPITAYGLCYYIKYSDGKPASFDPHDFWVYVQSHCDGLARDWNYYRENEGRTIERLMMVQDFCREIETALNSQG